MGSGRWSTDVYDAAARFRASTGASAFAHKAGLHVAGLVKCEAAYQHTSPELVGNEQRILVSELSGQRNILTKIKEQGIDDGLLWFTDLGGLAGGAMKLGKVSPGGSPTIEEIPTLASAPLPITPTPAICTASPTPPLPKGQPPLSTSPA